MCIRPPATSRHAQSEPHLTLPPPPHPTAHSYKMAKRTKKVGTYYKGSESDARASRGRDARASRVLGFCFLHTAWEEDREVSAL